MAEIAGRGRVRTRMMDDHNAGGLNEPTIMIKFMFSHSKDKHKHDYRWQLLTLLSHLQAHVYAYMGSWAWFICLRECGPIPRGKVNLGTFNEPWNMFVAIEVTSAG